MQRHKTPSMLNKLQQSFLLCGSDTVVVGIDDQTIEPTQLCRTEIAQIFRINRIDVTLGQYGLQLFEPVGRTVVPLVTEKQCSQFRLLCGEG